MRRCRTLLLFVTALAGGCSEKPEPIELPDLAGPVSRMDLAGSVSPVDLSGPADARTSTLCRDYCQEAIFHCKDGGYPIDFGGQTCEQVCATYRENGLTGDKKGNTVQCRITHVDLAGQNPQLHCPHAGPSGGGVCVD